MSNKNWESYLTSDDDNNNDNNDNNDDLPLKSFKLPSSNKKITTTSSVSPSLSNSNSSNSLNTSIPSSMALPPSKTLPVAAPKTDKVETLEEKIARVMAGINMPKNLPAKSPTALSSPFDKFSTTISAASSASSTPLSVSGTAATTAKSTPLTTPTTISKDLTSSGANIEQDIQPAPEKKRAGARIVKPGSNNSLSSLGGEDNSNSKISPSVAAITSQSPSTTPLPTPTEIKSNEFSIGLDLTKSDSAKPAPLVVERLPSQNNISPVVAAGTNTKIDSTSVTTTSSINEAPIIPVNPVQTINESIRPPSRGIAIQSNELNATKLNQESDNQNEIGKGKSVKGGGRILRGSGTDFNVTSPSLLSSTNINTPEQNQLDRPISRNSPIEDLNKQTLIQSEVDENNLTPISTPISVSNVTPNINSNIQESQNSNTQIETTIVEPISQNQNIPLIQSNSQNISNDNNNNNNNNNGDDDDNDNGNDNDNDNSSSNNNNQTTPEQSNISNIVSSSPPSVLPLPVVPSSQSIDENRGRSKVPIEQRIVTPKSDDQSISSGRSTSQERPTARVFKPTASNPAPTPTPIITRSKSQEKTRTPSNSSTTSHTNSNNRGSNHKLSQSTPTFTPQQRRFPELPSALNAVGYNSTPDNSSNYGHNRQNEWSITKRNNLDQSMGYNSQALTIPRYNNQLSNMYPESQSHDVKVVVRIRPFTIGEIQSGPRRVVSVNGNKLILVNPNAFDANPDTIAAAAAAVSLENMRCNDWAKVFCFDNCFWSYDPTDEGDTYVDQQGIYNELGFNISNDILRGISTCCFAYGHTSTGKTYTMFGGDELVNSKTKQSFIESEDDSGNIQLHPSTGLIPRVFMDIVNRVFSDSEVLQDTKITLSFIEIYQEKIRDCLSPVSNSAELRVREHPAIGPYVEHLTRVEVESVSDVLEFLYRGYEERSTASTHRNRNSSRSHAIATLELSPANAKDPLSPLSTRKTSNQSIPQPINIQKHPHIRCQMVDLAGSEQDIQNDFEQHENINSNSNRRRNTNDNNSNNNINNSNNSQSNTEKFELKMIRRSLSTLGYIIKALGQGNSPKGLPFRDSVLTWLLKDALSGQSNTTMLATVSPSNTCYDETLQTLKYAERLCQLSLTSKPGMESTGRVSINDTIDPDLSYSLATEYTRLKQELGGRPGSIASKHLLQQTISDPQQRLAKLDPYRPNYIEDDARYQSHNKYNNPNSMSNNNNNTNNRLSYPMVPSSATKTPRGNTLSHSYNGQYGNDTLIEHDLKEAYRQLHGKYVELQIELENTRTDRDTMQVEIRHLQESLEKAEAEKYLGSKSALNDMTLALRSAEAEVNELRGIILRKEETSDRLLGELADERQARTTVEKTARAQVTELINRLETLHKQGQVAMKESQKWQQESNIISQEKDIVENEVRSLKSLLSEKMDESDKRIRSLEDELRLSMEHINNVVKERDRTNTEITQVLKEKAEMAAKEVTLTQRIQELILEVEKAQNESKIKSELEIVKLQRDSLYDMIKQQEQTLQIQQKQSEASLKMLHQRQAALDRYEQKHTSENDELNILQENLQKLLNFEGETLYNELIDAKKLITIISTIKEKIIENNYLNDEIIKLNNEKYEIILKSKENDKKYEILSKEYRECNEQLEHYKKLTIDWETRSHYWQQVAKKNNSGYIDKKFQMPNNEINSSGFDISNITTNTSTVAAANQIGLNTSLNNPLDVNELRNENLRLEELLSQTQNELKKANNELESSKNEMSKEFSSLWLAVEQLNKLDASKDKIIKELTIERDNAVRECKELSKRYKEMKSEYDGLQSELQSIDLNLLDVADHEGIEVSDLLHVVHDHHPHVSNVLSDSYLAKLPGSGHSTFPKDRNLSQIHQSKSPQNKGLHTPHNQSYYRDSLRDRDSDIISEPGYYRNTESRERTMSARRGEKRPNQTNRRERSTSPSSRRSQSFNNEKGLEMQIEELSQFLNRDSVTRNNRARLRTSREYVS